MAGAYAIFGLAKNFHGSNTSALAVSATVNVGPLGDTSQINYAREKPCLLIGNVQYTDMANKTADVSLFSYPDKFHKINDAVTYSNNIPNEYAFGQYSGTTYNYNSGANALGCCTRASWGLLLVGKSMTEDECVTYNNAVNALMEVVKNM